MKCQDYKPVHLLLVQKANLQMFHDFIFQYFFGGAHATCQEIMKIMDEQLIKVTYPDQDNMGLFNWYTDNVMTIIHTQASAPIYCT